MKRTSTLLAIDPRFRAQFVALATYLHPKRIHPFESFRPVEAQMTAYNLGTSKARPGQSAHQYGLAVDFVPIDEHGKWYWPPAKDPVWDVVKRAAEQFQLESPIAWDRAHVQVPDWKALRSDDFARQLRRLYK